MCNIEDLIEDRIRKYHHDRKSVLNSSDLKDLDMIRLRQDDVIIQELKKILTGKGLERLSYV